MKPPSPGFVKTPMGLDYAPGEFLQRRRKNQLSDSYGDHHDLAARQVNLDKNNYTLSQQLSRRQMWNSRQRQDADQSWYYSEDSKFDSVSVTLVSTLEVSTAGER